MARPPTSRASAAGCPLASTTRPTCGTWTTRGPRGRREAAAKTDFTALLLETLLPRAERFNRENDAIKACFWSDTDGVMITYTILTHLFHAAILSFAGMAAMVVYMALHTRAIRPTLLKLLGVTSPSP